MVKIGPENAVYLPLLVPLPELVDKALSASDQRWPNSGVTGAQISTTRRESHRPDHAVDDMWITSHGANRVGEGPREEPGRNPEGTPGRIK